MIAMEIPGFGQLELAHLVSDFTGTLSVDGVLLPGVEKLLNEIAAHLTIHVVAADTLGTAREALANLPCTVTVLQGEGIDRHKAEFVNRLGATGVVALGNGNNDRQMLQVARIGIAVCEGEGCGAGALFNADVHVRSITDGLGLLLNPLRLKATLRT